MSTVVQLLLLAAAADGSIDQYEKFFIMKIIKNVDATGSLTEEDISKIQKDLADIAQEISTEQMINSIVARLDKEDHPQAYALALEVCLANDLVHPRENLFLKHLRSKLDLSANIVSAIHLSARLRYPSISLDEY